MRLLVVLAENNGNVVRRDALIDRVWGVEHGGDESLTRAVSLLRKALEDDRGARRMIETIPKQGYRLNARISEASDADSAEGPPVAGEIRQENVGASPTRIGVFFIALGVVAITALALFYALAPKSSAQAERSVAVMPFVALTSGPDDEYFADGLTEDVVNALWAVPEMDVIAFSSTAHFRGAEVSLANLRQSLDVAHIVEGAVRRTDQRVRVTAKLVRAADGKQLWSRAYDRPITDVLEIQTDIAENIAQSLDVVLDDEEVAAMQRAGLRNVDAYVSYRKANALQSKAHGELPQIPTLIEANRLFQETVHAAPGFFPAHFVQTDLYTHVLLNAAAGNPQSDLSVMTVEDASREFRTLLSTAYDAARNDLERAYVGAVATLYSDDWSNAGEYLDRIFATRRCAIDEQWTQILSTAFGRAQAARDFFDHTTRCAPFFTIQWVNAAMARLYLGDPAGALDTIEEAKARVGFNPLLERTRFEALLAAGRLDAAEETLQQLNGRVRMIEQIGMHAMRAERDRAEALAQKLYAEGEHNAYEDLAAPLGDDGDALILSIAPIIGDREAANAAAARIDARDFGPVQLAISTHYCLCGAPFDLEATPNFAAQLEASGLQWPPAAPIDYPLKDW